MAQALDSSKVAFWLSPTDRGAGSFRGSGTVIGDQHILTAKHLCHDEAGKPLTLWVGAAINASTSLAVKDVVAHPSLDIALVTVASFPARVRPAPLDLQQLESAKSGGFTLTGFFEGKDEEPQPLVVTQLDGQENHFLTDVKQPAGYSGGAVCAADAVWAVSTCHYGDVNIHRGCAVAVHQFWDWLEPRLPPLTAEAVKARQIRCPPGHSPVQMALWDALFQGQPSGWESMHGHGLTGLFDEAAVRREWGRCASSPQLFFQFCTRHGYFPAAAPSGEDLLSCLMEVLAAASHPGGTPVDGLPEPARRVLVALCSVGIEGWVHSAMGEAIRMPIAGPDGLLRLVLEDEWAVYLMAAARFSLRTRLAPNLTDRPPGLITVKAPLEGKHEDLLSPVRSAVVSAVRGSLVVNPSRRVAQLTLPAFRQKLQTDPLLGYKSDDAGNPLGIPAVREQAWTEFGMNVAEYGDSDVSTTSASDVAAVKVFAKDLRDMIDTLNAQLHPPIR